MSFIENADGNNFKGVFPAQIRPKGNARPSVVVADSRYFTQTCDDSQVVTLNQGARFEGTALLRDFRITDSQGYQAIIGRQAAALNPNDINQMSIRALRTTGTDRARAELTWHTTLVFTVFIMALIVVLLSVVSPCQGRVLSTLPTMLFYLLFFLVQTSPKSNGGKDKLDPVFWMWTANLAYLALAVMLNP